MARKLIATSVAIVLLGACGGGGAEPARSGVLAGGGSRSERVATTAEPVLLTGQEGMLAAVDANTDKTLLRTSSSQLSPSGDVIYVTRRHAVASIDATTLDAIGRTPAPAGMQLDVASASGRLLAFTEPEETGASPWIPAGRARTKITIVPTKNNRDSRTYDLRGNFGIEAFSTDDSQLFLIDFKPARHPWHYELRRLDLRSGRLREIARPKQNAPGSMNGTGRLSVFSPGGNQLYTLYTQQGPNYTHGTAADLGKGNVYAFVHLLDLDGAWTHCIDLPAPFGTGPVTSHAMALSHDGSRLYVADPSSGGVAVIDPASQRVLRSETADLRALRDGVTATVSPGGTLYLAGRRQILVFDGATLQLLRRLPLAHPVSAIATGTDDSKLYVTTGTRVRVLDALTGRRLS